MVLSNRHADLGVVIMGCFGELAGISGEWLVVIGLFKCAVGACRVLRDFSTKREMQNNFAATML